MKQIRITITKDDLKNASNFYDVDHCLLATAVKRETGETDISAGSTLIYINRKRYTTKDLPNNIVCEQYQNNGADLPLTAVFTHTPYADEQD